MNRRSFLSTLSRFRNAPFIGPRITRYLVRQAIADAIAAAPILVARMRETIRTLEELGRVADAEAARIEALYG